MAHDFSSTSSITWVAMMTDRYRRVHYLHCDKLCNSSVETWRQYFYLFLYIHKYIHNVSSNSKRFVM